VKLGLGTGLTIDPSYDMIGVPNWSTRERVVRFAEYVELLGHLVADGVTDYHGSYYQANGAVMNPGTVQRPRLPIMVAALGPQMMRQPAARLRTNCHRGTSRAAARTCVSRLRRLTVNNMVRRLVTTWCRS
jgi:alkanesulfonate monooxygenase SsuD/methylene tetrahydromethanopterin reductase-like flavin-dependent oxidoreductase (luciferase family)